MRVRLVALAVTVAAGAAAVTAAAGHAAPSGAPPGKPQSTTAPGKPNGNGSGSTTTPDNGNGKSHGNGHGGPRSGSAKGIVQSVSATGLVLRQLDGSEVSIAVTSATRVFVDGKRAGIAGVKPGFVVSAAWTGGTTRVLQALDLSSSAAVEVGVVRSVSSRTVVVRRSDGRTVAIRVGAKTRVLLDGEATTLRAVRVGYTVVFTAADVSRGKPARELRFLRPI